MSRLEQTHRTKQLYTSNKLHTFKKMKCTPRINYENPKEKMCTGEINYMNLPNKCLCN